ncbi:MAG: FAD-binding oxidoreductase [Myxococcales bacterium]
MTGPLPASLMGGLAAPAPAARALQRELSRLVGGRASVGSQDRIAASRDLWPRTHLWARAGRVGPLPDVVAWPSSLEELSALVRRCSQLSVPVVAYGGGTGSAGAVVPLAGGVAVDLKRMNRLLALDPEAREVEAEAGIVGEFLERRLQQAGLTLGHAPYDRRAATLGGWLATRSAGWSAGRNGRLEDLVATLTAVDGRGEVLTTPRRPLSGWDLAQVLMGSEGTLAVFASARLHVLSRPEATVFQAWRFASLRDAVEATRSLFRSGLRPASVRLSDPSDASPEESPEPATPVGRRGSLRRRFDEALGTPLSRVLARMATARPGGLNAAARVLHSCVLALSFEGPSELCELEAEEAGRLCVAARAEELGPEPARQWLSRKSAEDFAVSKAWDDGTFVDAIDLAVTWDRVLEVQRQVREAIASLALVRTRIGAAWAEGCSLEVLFAASAEDVDASVQRHDEIWRKALSAAQAAGAAASHHGGVGLQRLNAMQAQLGEGMRVVSAFKATFDPRGILNPGKQGAA